MKRDVSTTHTPNVLLVVLFLKVDGAVLEETCKDAVLFVRPRWYLGFPSWHCCAERIVNKREGDDDKQTRRRQKARGKAMN